MLAFASHVKGHQDSTVHPAVFFHQFTYKVNVIEVSFYFYEQNWKSIKFIVKQNLVASYTPLRSKRSLDIKLVVYYQE